MEKSSNFKRAWDEENNKFVFKPVEEAPDPNWCCVYGNYAKCEADEIEGAKAVLLEDMIDMIRELAKKDEFWIVKKVNGVPTVGWKVEFPQMLPEGYDAPAEKKPSKIIPVFDFGDAIRAMKDGERVARMGWNGKGMYVFLAHEADFVTDADISAFDQMEVEVADMLVMKTAQDTFQPGWLASQADMLAEDWYIV